MLKTEKVLKDAEEAFRTKDLIAFIVSPDFNYDLAKKQVRQDKNKINFLISKLKNKNILVLSYNCNHAYTIYDNFHEINSGARNVDFLKDDDAMLYYNNDEDFFSIYCNEHWLVDPDFRVYFNIKNVNELYNQFQDKLIIVSQNYDTIILLGMHFVKNFTLQVISPPSWLGKNNNQLGKLKKGVCLNFGDFFGRCNQEIIYYPS